jgi:hypothetical protein
VIKEETTMRNGYNGYGSGQGAAWKKGAVCTYRHSDCRVHTIKRACGHSDNIHIGHGTVARGNFFVKLSDWKAETCAECQYGLPIIANFPVFTAEFAAAHPLTG